MSGDTLRGLLERMNDTMEHRGPDDDGYFVGDGAGLAMRRLSIIDVDGGRQPITNEDGTLHIVFNGEIYNYRGLRDRLTGAGHEFRTHTDTETILHGYEEFGEDVVHHLEGMFAFAIWEVEKRRLFVARDGLGQKPLYYAVLADGFCFGSEPKALLALPSFRRSLDRVAMSHYMSLRSVPGHRTLLEGLHKLPAGTRGVWQDGHWTEDRYWRLTYGPKHAGTEPEVVEELRSILEAAVSSHLVADVEVGAFVSGGIDSSTVTAIMARASAERVPTFAIGVKEQGFDERPYAEMVAERYATDHHAEAVSADLIGMLPDMIHHMDEPVDPFAAGIYLVSGLAAKRVKVVLGGDGGDEMFAGYDRYAGQRLAEIYGALPAFLRNRIAGPVLRRWPETFGYKSVAQKFKWIDRIASISDPARRYAHSAGFLRFPHELKARIFTPAAWASIAEEDSSRIVTDLFAARSGDALLDRILYTDVETRLAEHLLPTVDRMSMAHSLEVRSPFVDRTVAEFAARIPARWKLKRLRLKHMLRRAAEPYLPRALIRRKKQGFGFPLAHWFRGPLRDPLHRLFAGSALAEDGLLDGRAMSGLVDEHAKARMDHNYRLWLLLNLELWYRMAVRCETRDAVAERLARARGRESEPAPVGGQGAPGSR